MHLEPVLRFNESLMLAHVPFNVVLIEPYHHVACCVIINIPQTHNDGLCAGLLESTLQTEHSVAANLA